MRYFSSLILALAITGQAVFAQFAATEWTLETDQTASSHYVASNKIVLKPGFRAKGSEENFEAQITPFVTAQGDPETINRDYTALPSGTVTGTTEGKFDVTPMGAAAYTIPIKVTPGTGGIEPMLTISYSSQAGDGAMGPGFAIAGLSVITLAPQNTFYGDAEDRPVKLDGSDRYALDGNRLIEIATDYTTKTCTYRTENNIFAKIISYHTTLQADSRTGANKFVVYTKDGLIKEYDPNPAIKPTGKTEEIAWYLTKVSDTKGNYMTISYTYDAANNEAHVSRIDYTGNATSSPVLSPYASVVFSYKERYDNPPAQYPYGIYTKQTKRLENITAYMGGSVVRSYDMEYTYAGLENKMHLLAVTETCTDGTKFNPTRFLWEYPGETQYSEGEAYTQSDTRMWGEFNGDGKADYLEISGKIWKIGKANAAGNGFETELTNQFNYEPIWPQVGDINGDGISDIVFMSTLNNKTCFVYFGKTDGTGFGSTAITVATSSLPDHCLPLIVNIDGKGKSEVILRFQNNHTNYVYKLNAANTAFTHSSSDDFTSTFVLDVRTGDYNGDGYADYFWYDGNVVAVYLNNGSGKISSTREASIACNSAYAWGIVDIERDGFDDIYTFYGAPTTQNRSLTIKSSKKGTSFFSFDLYDNILDEPDEGDENDVETFTILRFDVVANLNGVPGFAINYQQLLRKCNSDGCLRTYIDYTNLLQRDISQIELVFEVVNLKKDIIILKNSTDFSPGIHVVANVIPDINGDGYSDFGEKVGRIIHTDVDNTVHETYLNNPPRIRFSEVPHSDLLTSITDGVGNVTKFEYAQLNNPVVYAKSELPAYPYGSVTVPMWVVKKVKTNSAIYNTSGIEQYVSSSYKYENLMAHKAGRGLLGFKKVTKTNDQMGLSSTIEYQWHGTRYYSGISKAYSKVLVDGQPKVVSLTTNEYTLKTFNGSTYIGVYTLTKSSAYKFDASDVDVNTNPVVVTGQYAQTESSYEYDSYGNSTKVTVKNGDNAYNETVTTTSTFDNNETKWHLGRLRSSTVTHAKDGLSNIVRKSKFLYDATSGLLTDEIIEPTSLTDNSKTYGEEFGSWKTHTYDAFGNILTSTLEATTDKAHTAASKQSRRLVFNIYDTKGRFVTESRNALDHATKYEYNQLTGHLTKVTDPNGLVATNVYDGFGRKISETDPLGNTSTYATHWAVGSVATMAPANAVFYAYSKPAGGAESWQFFSRLGQALRSVTTGFDGTKIYTDTEYNLNNQITKTSQPYFSDATNKYWLQNTAYDAKGRVTSQTLPDGNTITYDLADVTTVKVNKPLIAQQYTKIDYMGRTIESYDGVNHAVTFAYDAVGNLLSSARNGKSINNTYDNLGLRKTSMNDPDLGVHKSFYNGFGELVYECKEEPGTAAEKDVVKYTYDVLGRLTKKEEAGFKTTDYVYDNLKKGLLSQVKEGATVLKSMTYDSYCRITSVTERIDGTDYTTSTTYDNFGRVSVTTYPTGGLKVKNDYNQYGFLFKVSNSDNPSTVYWTAGSMNAQLQLKQATLGSGTNAIANNYTFDAETGNLTDIVSTRGSVELQNWEYTYDAAGNLTQQKDNRTTQWEDFTYTNASGNYINMLTGATYKSASSKYMAMEYDLYGNIKSKTMQGTKWCYNYDNTKPNQLIAVTNFLNNADVQSARNNQTVTYTPFDKVLSISEKRMIGGSPVEVRYMDFTYGYDHTRQVMNTWQKADDGTVQWSLKRVYVNALYERETDKNNVTKEFFYIYAGGSRIAVLEKPAAGASTLTYLLKDRMGSITAMVKSDGSAPEYYSYDAWGRRRDAGNWMTYLSATGKALRGFTGQEQLDLFELVNLNGRIYDPLIGRFMTADPLITDPMASVSHNRYTYCMNLPFAFTDPSGYSWWSDNWETVVATVVAVVVAVVVTVATYGVGVFAAPSIISAGCAVAAGAAGGFAGAMVGSLLQGASFGDALMAGFQGAVIGFISAGVSYGIGTAFSQGVTVGGQALGEVASHAVKAVVHGGVQGLLSMAQGGNFTSGFLAGAFGSMAGYTAQNMQLGFVGGLVYSSVVGGTASVLGGGKFANGAVTGAFVYLFNEAAHQFAKRPSFDNMSNNYPGDETSEEVYKLIGGKVYQNHLNDPAKYENSCALRLSRALNYSGAEIPYIEGQTGSGSDGKWYFYRVSDLKKYLTNTYGSVDLTGNASDFANKKGIILFQNCGWSNATGHLDLWNGNGCGNHCYWNQCNDASLWYLP